MPACWTTSSTAAWTPSRAGWSATSPWPLPCRCGWARPGGAGPSTSATPGGNRTTPGMPRWRGWSCAGPSRTPPFPTPARRQDPATQICATRKRRCGRWSPRSTRPPGRYWPSWRAVTRGERPGPTADRAGQPRARGGAAHPGRPLHPGPCRPVRQQRWRGRLAAAGAGRRAVVLGRLAAGVRRARLGRRCGRGRAAAAVHHPGPAGAAPGGGGRVAAAPGRDPCAWRGGRPVTAAELSPAAAVQAPQLSPAAGEDRTVGRVVELASGLLMLLDEHGITGRLPLDARAQTSRLRYAVKLAIQTTAAPCSPPRPVLAGPDPAGELRAWIAAQPWAIDSGPVGWVYLLCFRDPTTGEHRPLRGNGCRGQFAGHYWGKAASSGLLTALWRVNGSEFAELTLVALLRSRGSRPCRRGVCCQLLELVPRVVLPNGALHGDATPGGQPHPGGRQRAGGPARHGRSARQPRANRARNAQQQPVADRPRDP